MRSVDMLLTAPLFLRRSDKQEGGINRENTTDTKSNTSTTEQQR